MSLETIFADFKAELAKIDPTVLFTGPADTDDESRPNRINWSPVRARHEEPRGLGGALLTRRWEILVECWGDTLTRTEDLVNLFINAAQVHLTQHSYGPGQETWDPGGKTAKGCVCRVLFPIMTPIQRRPAATRPITAIDANYTVQPGATP